jgi:linoleoyl-CoA desaturase
VARITVEARVDHADNRFAAGEGQARSQRPRGALREARARQEMRQGRRYAAHGKLYEALHRRVDEYFARTGASRTSAPGMWRKPLIIMAWFAASYALLTFWASTPWQAGLCSVSLGLAVAGIGFNIQHDGGHGGYSRHRFINALMAQGLDLVGGSSYVWRWKHNVFHHSHPNVDGLDADVNVKPFCRLTPEQQWRPGHRFQHVYVWFLYSLLAIKWQFIDDFMDVIVGRIGAQRFPRPRGLDLLGLLGWKAFFLVWAFVIPLWLHPVGSVLLCYAAASMTVSVVLSVTFQLAHAVEGASAPELEGTGRTRVEWAEHQIVTSVDFAPGNAVLTWYLGGLNYQIEHHLFPGVCHRHLQALAPIVQATCAEYGVPYRVYPTARAAVASHVRWLRQLGVEPALVPPPAP